MKGPPFHADSAGESCTAQAMTIGSELTPLAGFPKLMEMLDGWWNWGKPNNITYTLMELAWKEITVLAALAAVQYKSLNILRTSDLMGVGVWNLCWDGAILHFSVNKLGTSAPFCLS